MALSRFATLSIILYIVCAWPGLKRQEQTDDPNWQLDTALVHNSCCEGHRQDDKTPRPSPGVAWSRGFTMDWKFFLVPQCDGKQHAIPPYYPYPSDPHKTVTGHTYSNADYRGGAQRQQYQQSCLAIFADLTMDYPCDFLNIAEENQSYLVQHKKTGTECCLMAKPFTPPGMNFTEKLNYNGLRKAQNDKNYHSFEIHVPMLEGPFEYSFWEENKESNGQSYYEPAFFYFLGQDAECDNYLMSQQFENYIPVAPDDSAFEVPAVCKKEDISFCPGFAPPESKVD